MLGKALILECLKNELVEEILLISRNSTGMQHNKLKELLHSDFSNFDALKDHISGYNTCFYCLGISAAGLSEEKYSKITYDYTINLAELMLKVNPNSNFCYISGAGTDSTEKGRMMWARVKGKTENKLLSMPFNQAYMFRPGYIQPLDGLKSRTALYNIAYLFSKPFYFLLKHLPNYITNTRSLAKAMINAVLNGYDKKILTAREINDLGKS